MEFETKDGIEYAILDTTAGEKVKLNMTKINAYVSNPKKLTKFAENISWIYNTLCEITPSVFFRKDLKLTISSEFPDKSFYTFITKYFSGDGVCLGRFMPPDTISINLDTILFDSYLSSKSPRQKKYVNRYCGYDKNRSLDFEKFAFDQLVTTMIHELLHAHQHIIRYRRMRYIHYQNGTEYPIELATGQYIVAFEQLLYNRIHYRAMDNARLCERCYEELYRNPMTKENAKEIYRSNEPKDLRIKANYAKWFGQCAIPHGGKRYKKASLEYILARNLVFRNAITTDAERNAFYEKNIDKIIKRIRDMRMILRQAPDVVYDGIIWKENGKWVQRLEP